MEILFRFTFVSIFVLNIFVVSSTRADDVYWDDGGYHKINNSTYRLSNISLDKNKMNNPGTDVDIFDGGVVLTLKAYNKSTVTIQGGLIDNNISAYGNSTVSISAGTVDWGLGLGNNSTLNMSNGKIKRYLTARDDSIVNMSGGNVYWNLTARDNTLINMSGGQIGYAIVGYNNTNIIMTAGTARDSRAFDDAIITMSGGTIERCLQVYENGSIYLNGSGFEVTDLNGATYSLSYGSILSDYGTLVDVINNDYYTGTITGVLADGSVLDNTFEIYTFGDYIGAADIIIIPEPTALFLFLAGIPLLKKRNK